MADHTHEEATSTGIPLSPAFPMPLPVLQHNKSDHFCGAVIVETDDLLFGGKGGEFRQAMLNIKDSHQQADYSGLRLEVSIMASRCTVQTKNFT
eukprot:575638-Amphidinium_carterae.1